MIIDAFNNPTVRDNNVCQFAIPFRSIRGNAVMGSGTFPIQVVEVVVRNAEALRKLRANVGLAATRASDEVNAWFQSFLKSTFNIKLSHA